MWFSMATSIGLEYLHENQSTESHFPEAHAEVAKFLWFRLRRPWCVHHSWQLQVTGLGIDKRMCNLRVRITGALLLETTFPSRWHTFPLPCFFNFCFSCTDLKCSLNFFSVTSNLLQISLSKFKLDLSVTGTWFFPSPRFYSKLQIFLSFFKKLAIKY